MLSAETKKFHGHWIKSILKIMLKSILLIISFLTSTIWSSLTVMHKLWGKVLDSTSNTHVLQAVGIVTVPWKHMTLIINNMVILYGFLCKRLLSAYLNICMCKHHLEYQWSEGGLSIDTCTNAGFGQAIHRGTTSLHSHSEVANFQQLLQPLALKDPMKFGSKYFSMVICSEKALLSVAVFQKKEQNVYLRNPTCQNVTLLAPALGSRQ